MLGGEGRESGVSGKPPRHATPRHNTPHPTMPRHATPCHTLPCHATPPPCHATPCRATPCHAMPRHATPCHATPTHHATPRHATCPTMPCHATPCHTMPHHTMPCHAKPRYTMPRHTMPCHATPRGLLQKRAGGPQGCRPLRVEVRPDRNTEALWAFIRALLEEGWGWNLQWEWLGREGSKERQRVRTALRCWPGKGGWKKMSRVGGKWGDPGEWFVRVARTAPRGDKTQGAATGAGSLGK